MNEHHQLIEKFYSSFAKKDWKTMQSCYHDDIEFSDPVFQNLKGKRAKAMWHMLAESAKNFSLTYSGIQANEKSGSCHWDAHYDFSRTGRRVHNSIDAEFKFKEGKIISHTDHFDLWRWSRMALGLSGLILGWSPIVRNKIRETANSGLEKFIKSHADLYA